SWWLVGRGDQIQVWKDNWLPTVHPCPPNPRNVADLLNHHTCDWNYDRLSTYLDSEDISRVLQIRPSVSSARDVLTWSYTTTGNYTVKSGHYLQQQLTIARTINENKISFLFDDAKQNTLMQNLQLWLTHMKSQSETIVFFLGWRIWKMRNALLFQHQRDHITHTI
ncbi:unnamed protein product, partial [Thlaspi arvense]